MEAPMAVVAAASVQQDDVVVVLPLTHAPRGDGVRQNGDLRIIIRIYLDIAVYI